MKRLFIVFDLISKIMGCYFDGGNYTPLFFCFQYVPITVAIAIGAIMQTSYHVYFKNNLLIHY